jgi:hypothetical protein
VACRTGAARRSALGRAMLIVGIVLREVAETIDVGGEADAF